MNTYIYYYKKILSALTYSAAFLAGLCILATALIIVYEIIMRGLFKSPTEWVLEVSTYLILSAGFLGIAVAYRERSHVKVSVLTERLSPTKQRYMDIFTSILSILLFLILMTESADLVQESLAMHRLSPSTLQVPLFIPQSTLVIGFALVLGEVILHLLELIFQPQVAAKQHSNR